MSRCYIRIRRSDAGHHAGGATQASSQCTVSRVHGVLSAWRPDGCRPRARPSDGKEAESRFQVRSRGVKAFREGAVGRPMPTARSCCNHRHARAGTSR
jgi:hypothetical protein